MIDYPSAARALYSFGMAIGQDKSQQDSLMQDLFEIEKGAYRDRDILKKMLQHLTEVLMK